MSRRACRRRDRGAESCSCCPIRPPTTLPPAGWCGCCWRARGGALAGAAGHQGPCPSRAQDRRLRELRGQASHDLAGVVRRRPMRNAAIAKAWTTAAAANSHVALRGREACACAERGGRKSVGPLADGDDQREDPLDIGPGGDSTWAISGGSDVVLPMPAPNSRDSRDQQHDLAAARQHQDDRPGDRTRRLAQAIRGDRCRPASASRPGYSRRLHSPLPRPFRMPGGLLAERRHQQREKMRQKPDLGEQTAGHRCRQA